MAASSRFVFVVLACSCLLASLSGQTGTALVRRAPTLNGRVEGSIRQMTAENTTFNSGARVAGDLLIPGTPTVQLNGSPTYGGTLEGTGATTPTTHKVTLNSGAVLGHVVRRSDAVALPTVAAPPQPTGTRSVSLNNSSQSPGDFATLKNLTLNSNVGQIAVPPGSYGNFNANSGSGFTLGIAGATTPAFYGFQNLTLNSNSVFQVVGPVVVTLNGGFSTNANMGDPVHPEWLTLRIAGGGLSVASNKSVYAHLEAPDGTLTLNGGSQFVGLVASDRLIVNSNALLRLVAPATVNQPPTVAITAPADGSSYLSPASIVFAATASDVDGAVAKVEFFSGATSLGEDFSAPYGITLNGVTTGTYSYHARATDSDGATTDSAAVSVTVQSPNQPPTVSLTAPLDGALYTAPVSLSLAATAADADGSVMKVEFFEGTAKLGEDFSAPYELDTGVLAPGAYVFSAKAWDDVNAATLSNPINVTVVTPNQPPAVNLTAPPDGALFMAPASFSLMASATDADGSITKVEFYQGGVLLGEDTAAPFEVPVSNLAAGSHNFVARATDNSGSATDSAPVSVTVQATNQPPVVSLVSPASGASYAAPANITLQAEASDPDGTVARVEFYEGGTKLGEDLSTPYSLAWNNVTAGSYVLTARAFDNNRAEAVSAPSNVSVLSQVFTLPFLAGFEESEGYALGPIQGQHGWMASSSSIVTDADFASGLRSVLVPGQSTPLELSHAFTTSPAPDVVFVDFFTLPHAAESEASSTRYETQNGARIAFVREGDTGRFRVYRGNGAGGGAWESSQSTLPVDGEGYSQGWARLTVRLDFAAQKWDLYVNGAPAALDIGFPGVAQSELGAFSLLGSTAAPTLLDDFLAASENPLFADADHDGMDDGWETTFGLNPALNDRAADPDGDGVSNLVEYQAGTDPSDYYNGVAPSLTIVSGNSQTGTVGEFNSQPFVVSVTNASGTVALANAPVGFVVLSGGGKLALTHTDNPTLSDTITLRTDPNGTMQVYYQQPGIPDTPSTIQASAGGSQVAFTTTSLASAPPDSDGNGLLDSWELQYFGRIGVNPAGDADNDGVTNLQEYQDGTDPTVPFFSPSDTDGDGLPDAWEQRYFGTLDFGPDDQFNEMDRTLLQHYQQGLVPRLLVPKITDGLRAWFSARSGYFFDENSGKVRLWADLSGNGFHLRQADSAAQPNAYSSEYGEQFMLFDGSQRMAALSADVMNGATDLTVLAVIRPDGSQAADAAVLALGAGASEGFRFKQNGATLNQYALSWPRVPDQAIQGGAATVGAASYTVQLITFAKSAAVQTSRLDGALQNTVAVAGDPDPARAPLSVGGPAGGAFSGAVYEIMVYNRALTATELERIEDALLIQHGLGDSNFNGLLDKWELMYFGHLGVDPYGDPDGDGASNRDELLAETDPLDYFNGQVPALDILSGDNQSGIIGRFNEAPFRVAVTLGGQPVPSAQVVFNVTAGGGLLSSDNSGNDTPTDSFTTQTDGEGIATVYFKQPTEPDVQSTIRVSTGTVETVFTSVSVSGSEPYAGQELSLPELRGNHQYGMAGQFNLQPFMVVVWNGEGTAPVSNAPVAFSVVRGGGKLAVSDSGNVPLSDTLSLVTDGNGRAKVYCRHGDIADVQSQVGVLAGVARGTFVTRSFARSVATGAQHAVAVKADGTVWAWGANASGQLGDGTTAASMTPVSASGLEDIIAVAAAADHSLALDAGGLVWRWGGGPTYGATLAPVLLAEVTGAADLAAGTDHHLVLKRDGSVWTVNFTAGSPDPAAAVPVPGLSGAMEVAIGTGHNLALATGGVIWAWGSNASGQLGDGTELDRATPARVLDLEGAVRIAAGAAHSLALLADGTVRAWGANASGQLGDGSTVGRNVPVRVPGLADIVGVAAAGATSYALRSDGTVWAWGANDAGQLGNGSTAASAVPVQVTGLFGVTGIVAGADHGLVPKSDGAVWGWGNNSYWQTEPAAAPAPVAINLASQPMQPPEDGEAPPEANPGPSPDPTGAVRLQITLPPRFAGN